MEVVPLPRRRRGGKSAGGAMAEVVPIEELSPHLSGEARCLDCKHEWVAVAPTGTTWMECPKCGLERGRYVAQCERSSAHWHCKCGNNLFYISEEGAYCPNCGLAHEF